MIMSIRKVLKANGLNQNKKGGNMGKAKVLFLVVILSAFILGGISYAMTGMINAAGQAKVDKAGGIENVDSRIAAKEKPKGPGVLDGGRAALQIAGELAKVGGEEGRAPSPLLIQELQAHADERDLPQFLAGMPNVAENNGLDVNNVKKGIAIALRAADIPLAQVRPDLADKMEGLVTIPASAIINEDTFSVAFRMFNDAIDNGKSVSINATEDAALDAAASVLVEKGRISREMLSDPGKVLFLKIDDVVLAAILDQFKQANGDFLKATANLLAPVVQNALKGGV